MLSFISKLKLRLRGIAYDVTRDELIDKFELFTCAFIMLYPLKRDIDNYEIEMTLMKILNGENVTVDEYIKIKESVTIMETYDKEKLILESYRIDHDLNNSTRALHFGMYKYAKKAVDEGKATEEEFAYARALTYSDKITDKITDILQRLCKDAIVESIKENPGIIQLYDDPDEEMQMTAIKSDRRAIEFIQNPSANTLLYLNGIEA